MKHLLITCLFCFATTAQAAESCDWRCDVAIDHVNSYGNVKAVNAYIASDNTVAVEATGQDTGPVTFIGRPSGVLEGVFIVDTITPGWMLYQ